MKKLVIGALALLTAFTVPTLAQTSRGEFREHRQQNRVMKGVVTGRLTPREARRLEAQQDRIDRTQRRAGRDGYVSQRERSRIERLQDRASRNIYRKKNNYRNN